MLKVRCKIAGKEISIRTFYKFYNFTGMMSIANFFDKQLLPHYFHGRI